MPQPTRQQVHVNRPLTNISIAFMNNREDYVAERVFPRVPVAKQSDLYFKYLRDNWFRSDAQKRAGAQESAGSGYELETDSYFADVWAIHKDVSDQERANTDDPLDADRDATEFVTEQIMLRKEKIFVEKYHTTGLWTGSSTGTDITASPLWDAANSDPIADVRAQIRAGKKKTGKKFNTMTVSGEVHDALLDNDAVLDRISGGSTRANPALVTRELLAQAFEVDRYLVAEAIENTAAEGQDMVGAEIFGKHALLSYAEPNPGLRKASAGYVFTWTGLLGGAAGLEISRFRMEPLKADRIEAECAFDMKLVASDLGAFFASVIS